MGGDITIKKSVNGLTNIAFKIPIKLKKVSTEIISEKNGSSININNIINNY
jgi:hypothetical protein